MNHRSVVLLALGSVFLAGAPAFAQRGGRGGVWPAEYGWLSNLERGKAEARKSGKPLLVVLRCQP